MFGNYDIRHAEDEVWNLFYVLQVSHLTHSVLSQNGFKAEYKKPGGILKPYSSGRIKFAVGRGAELSGGGGNIQDNLKLRNRSLNVESHLHIVHTDSSYLEFIFTKLSSMTVHTSCFIIP